MEFEDDPRDEAYSALVGYKPLEFITQARQHSKVKLTWDDDDVDCIRVTRQKFCKEDLEAYIASSSNSNSDEDNVDKIKRKYQNFRAKAEEEQENIDQDMEITFASRLSEAASGLLERKKERENVENEISIETYMQKQKEKRQKKKQAKKEENETEGDAEDQGQLFSDDEVNIDQSDPFFQSEIGQGMAPKSSRKSESKNRKNKKLTAEEKAEEAKKQAELELLVVDADDGRKHFNMKDIIKKEKKGKKGKKITEDTDKFEINVSDPRFTALHDSHHFAIDPTNPQQVLTKHLNVANAR
ncbi:pre-rRNA-processing protein esf1 [Basidiobolus ranarum]|uniref:Pre-rRNA-processing protein esf1 n=1 Tax=Basidiobolus ranarum TaxID=34480 RepID=A0ABR2VPB4_9FUNG